MKFSLKYRIAALVFSLEAIMMAVVLWTTLGYAIDNSIRQIESAQQVTMNIIGSIARVALLYEDYDNIQGYVDELPRNANILAAMLADKRNIIVASNSLTDLGQPLPALDDSEIAHWKIIDISNPAGMLGTPAVRFSDEESNAIYRNALTRGAVTAVSGMVIIALVSIGFGHLLTRRLNTVVHAAEEVAGGNYSIRTRLSGNDEIGQVGKAFDTMAEVIAAEKIDLSVANDELEQRVRERTEGLKDANKEYEAFAYAVSHDLRAPLRAMNGFSEILEEEYGETLDDTAKDYLARIRNGATRMSELIDDLLALSRVNRAEISNKPINLSSICEDVIEELKSSHNDHEVEIRVEPGMNTHGDPRLMRDALMNLIGNAWKFTRKTGQPEIRVSSKKVDGKTVYSIEDNGAGFDETYVNKLFTPFQRLHNAQDFPGTGIGLSTVRRIIVRHNGDIWAESSGETGAVFSFTLGESKPGNRSH